MPPQAASSTPHAYDTLTVRPKIDTQQWRYAYLLIVRSKSIPGQYYLWTIGYNLCIFFLFNPKVKGVIFDPICRLKAIWSHRMLTTHWQSDLGLILSDEDMHIYWQSDRNRYSANITEQMVTIYAIFFFFSPKVKGVIFDPIYRVMAIWSKHMREAGRGVLPLSACVNHWCINDKDNSLFRFNLAWWPKAQQHLTTAAASQALI